MHGRGIYYDPLYDNIYEGWFKDNEFFKGRCIYPDGTYYEGTFNRKFGKIEGTLFFGDGTRYVGTFSNDTYLKGKYFAHRGFVVEIQSKDNYMLFNSTKEINQQNPQYLFNCLFDKD